MGGPVAKAMVVVRRRSDGALLVQHDTAGPKRFDRLLGGHIEFGELAEDAARREMLEEVDREVRVLRRLGVLENVFEHEGVPGHEVIFVFEAEFADPSDGEFDELTMCDEPTVLVRWRSTAATEPPLYPDGLVDLLAP